MAKVKVGLALAGGGVRGAGHLGVVKALYENKIYPEIFTGTSAGSIVASSLAYGYSPDKTLQKFESISKEMIDIAYGYILKNVFHPSSIEGFVKGDRIEEMLKELYSGNNISKVHPPLGIVTTDINKGKQIIFSNMDGDKSKINDDKCIWQTGTANLHEIVRASCGIPPIFIPKHIGDFKLVDGGLVNNLPSDVAWSLGADKVISLDLGFSSETTTEGVFEIAIESVNIFMSRIIDENRNNFGLYLNPQIFDVSALDTGRIQECYERGYKYGLSQIDNIVKYLEEE